MANLVDGLFHFVQGIVQSILAVLQSFFNIIYSLVHGVVALVWDLLENVAGFVGASVQFLISNIVIIGILVLGFVLYTDRNRRGSMGNELKKKAQ